MSSLVTMAGFTVSAILKFTPLSGAHNEEPLCYLLEVSPCAHSRQRTTPTHLHTHWPLSMVRCVASVSHTHDRRVADDVPSDITCLHPSHHGVQQYRQCCGSLHASVTLRDKGWEVAFHLSPYPPCPAPLLHFEILQ